MRREFISFMMFWKWKKMSAGKIAKSNGNRSEREREEQKSGKMSVEESYYLSNEVGNYKDVAQAVRQHWQVETNNASDVGLQEDKMRSKKKEVTANDGRFENFNYCNFAKNQMSE